MSNPGKAAALNGEHEDIEEAIDEVEQADTAKDNEEVAFEKAVQKAVSGMTRGSDGKYVLPDDVSPAVKHAAILEKRRRDTQSEYTKVAQQKKALEAENAALKSKALKDVQVALTPEQTAELDELKFSDPEAWRKKMNRLELEALAVRKKELEDEVTKVSADSLAKDELERRQDVLAEFNQAHPDFILDDSVIANDIPPRITKRLETGEISFEAFLQECYDYTKTGKVIKQEKTLGQPNLSMVGGGSTPDKRAETQDIVLSYNKEVY